MLAAPAAEASPSGRGRERVAAAGPGGPRLSPGGAASGPAARRGERRDEGRRQGSWARGGLESRRVAEPVPSRALCTPGVPPARRVGEVGASGQPLPATALTPGKPDEKDAASRSLACVPRAVGFVVQLLHRLLQKNVARTHLHLVKNLPEGEPGARHSSEATCLEL